MPTIVSQVSASNQDCLKWLNFVLDEQFSITDSTVAQGYSGLNKKEQESGLYFPNLPIPKNSTIQRAYLILRASENRPDTGFFSYLRAENNSTPLTFSTLVDYLARDLVPRTAGWRPAFQPWVKDQLYASPDLSALIQYITDRPDWVAGNPMVLFWKWSETPPIFPKIYEREAYSYDSSPAEAPRLEITFTPPTPPPPPPPLPPPIPPPPPRPGWYGLDLEYEYLDDGFKLTFHTDVPCHLFCRMTTEPPRKHALPSYRRGLALQGDIRFCFVVYEDNEQDEPGDTLIHTFYKPAWPICETRWFYFIGSAYGDPSPSESPIFKFHFPAPPPEPPPPLQRLFIGSDENRYLVSTHGLWTLAWAGTGVWIPNTHGAPFYRIGSGPWETVSWFIARGFLFFDLSSLPATAQIISANLYIYPVILDFPPIDPTLLNITEGKQGAGVDPADWPKQNSVTDVVASRQLDTFTLNVYNSIPFTAYGLELIKTLTPFNLCVRQQNDIDNDEPPALARHAIYYHTSQKGIGYRPYLEVNYNPA